jgi:hypothetical protein
LLSSAIEEAVRPFIHDQAYPKLVRKESGETELITSAADALGEIDGQLAKNPDVKLEQTESYQKLRFYYTNAFAPALARYPIPNLDEAILGLILNQWKS